MNYFQYYNDKVIWITGASSGIGEALSVSLLKNTNSQLILSARNFEKLNDIVQKFNVQKRVLILPFDLENFNAEPLVQQVIQTFGRIDILINNGGVSQRAMALETSDNIEKKLFDINYFSYIKLSKSVLPFMIQQKYGHIVVMSSIAGKFGFYLRSTYSAAKHALHGYFESLRLEYEKEGIIVTMVCPGKVKTNVSINALTSLGKTHNQMDESHQNAMNADIAADKILKNIARQKEEVYIGGKEIIMVYLKKYCTPLFNWLIRKQSPY
ncbi:MAG: SDR family NAD(P)-dependent oxidoreductase [Bacteroidia bacterium]|nr:SDR family NAD(P)-dependent oxidoreductase [Bacteroidia bacterium]